MACAHLQQLFRLCQDHDLKLASSDLIHIVCNQCGEQEVCPSVLMDEYDAKQQQELSPKIDHSAAQHSQ